MRSSRRMGQVCRKRPTHNSSAFDEVLWMHTESSAPSPTRAANELTYSRMVLTQALHYSGGSTRFLASRRFLKPLLLDFEDAEAAQ